LHKMKKKLMVIIIFSVSFNLNKCFVIY